MAIHIRELSIDQFKGINKLSLRNIGDVSIILGDNNAGKTSILELLLCMNEPTSLWNIRNAFRSNGLLGTMFIACGGKM
jgi:predicted ATP-dependent endonuclease of OLD family